MDGNSPAKAEPTTPTLIDLLKKYTNRVDERETLWKAGTRACREQQKVQTNEIERLKTTVHGLQSKSISNADPSTTATKLSEEQDSVNYKARWEESEAKYRKLEQMYQQLENGTVKQLQDKVDQLQGDYNQMKLLKDRFAEICACRQLSNLQMEQLKALVNNDVSAEVIANKTDFHQQTLKLRDIVVKHNDELLSRLEEMLKKKRKRNQYEADFSGGDDAEDDDDYQ